MAWLTKILVSPWKCRPRRLAGLVLLVAASVSGCQTPKLLEHSPLPLPGLGSGLVEDTPAEPEEMNVIWSDAVYSMPGKGATRGFGGHLFFYDKDQRPIEVDGQLAVFAYDDSRHTHLDSVADRRYVFTAEQLKSHLGQSRFGPSYSIWIPWQPVGGDERSISLLPVFTTTDGKVVVGPHAMNLLPGKKREEQSPEEIEKPQGAYDVQQTSHVQRDAQGAPPNNATSVISTTVPLTPGLQQQINSAMIQQHLGRIGQSLAHSRQQTVAGSGASQEASARGSAAEQSPPLPASPDAAAENVPGAETQTAPQATPNTMSQRIGPGSAPPANPTFNAPPNFPQSMAAPPSTRYAPPTRRAPAWPAARPGPARARIGRRPLTPRYGLTFPPAPGASIESGLPGPAAGQAGY
jgi:hypothetical protein